MADVLSQSQIDALLKGISSGEPAETMEEVPTTADGRKVRDYDFKSPKKFTKEQLKLINNLHENFGRQLSTYFSTLLRTFCEAKVMQVEEQRYYEFNNALQDNTMISLFDIKPENEKLDEMTILVEFSSTIAYSIIDRLLGGVGIDNDLEREMTDMERNIMETVLARMDSNIKEAWETYLPISAKLSSIETNPRLLQLFSPEDSVVIVLMELTLQDLHGTLTLCLPTNDLEGLLLEFIPKYMRSGVKNKANSVKGNERKESIETMLESADISMNVVFDTIELQLVDILRLQPNDVIPLNKPLDSEVEIVIDKKPYFKGTLGQTKSKKAVRINNIL